MAGEFLPDFASWICVWLSGKLSRNTCSSTDNCSSKASEESALLVPAPTRGRRAAYEDLWFEVGKWYILVLGTIPTYVSSLFEPIVVQGSFSWICIWCTPWSLRFGIVYSLFSLTGLWIFDQFGSYWLLLRSSNPLLSVGCTSYHLHQGCMPVHRWIYHYRSGRSYSRSLHPLLHVL